MKDYVDRSKDFCMLWYDVVCLVFGFFIFDVVKYFIQRYNSIKLWYSFYRFFFEDFVLSIVFYQILDLSGSNFMI